MPKNQKCKFLTSDSFCLIASHSTYLYRCVQMLARSCNAKSPSFTQLKDQFLKKMLLKRANTRRLFFAKLKTPIIVYSNWKKIQVFKIAKFEFKVTVQYGQWQNASSCDPLMQWKTVSSFSPPWSWGGALSIWSLSFWLENWTDHFSLSSLECYRIMGSTQIKKKKKTFLGFTSKLAKIVLSY